MNALLRRRGLNREGGDITYATFYATLSAKAYPASRAAAFWGMR